MSSKLKLINTVSRSKKIVDEVLCTDKSLAVVALVFRRNLITGRLSLVAMSGDSIDGVVIFDISTCPSMLIDGQIKRILQAERVIKVVHDCKDICVDLQELHNIVCNCMFDTQVAYTLNMEKTKLCPRLIAYADLHSNVTRETLKLHYIQGDDRNFWDKRPLSQEMYDALVEEVISLLHDVYPIMLKRLHHDMLNEFEARCALAARGIRVTNDKRPYKYKPSCSAPLMNLTEQQRKMLENTKPLSTEYSL